MKQLQLMAFAVWCCWNVQAQQNTTYGLVRKNFYSTVTSPFDSLLVYEELDSSTIRLGSIDPTTGYVTNIGPGFMQGVNLTGSTLNPYDSTFIFVGGGMQLQTFDLNTGLIVNSAPITNPISMSYFDNFRFNNADSTLYGLARRSTYDSVTMVSSGEVYLAKINSTTGIITQISANSVAPGYALAGSAIDPHQMVYYFSTGTQLIGLDIYDGNVYNSVPIQIPDGDHFDNFAYSCADTAIYGLVRKNYYSYITDSLWPGEPFQVFDSATIRLGRIDPATGQVTVISPYTISTGGYSLNSGATIDQDEMVYYYSNGSHVIGVSLITGELMSFQQLTYQDGQFVDLMRNLSDCLNSKAMRPKGGSLSLTTLHAPEIQVVPNPAQTTCTIRTHEPIKSLTIVDASGKIVQSVTGTLAMEATFETHELQSGWYMLYVNDQSAVKLSVIH